MGARRLRSLVKYLPPGSALHRAVDPEGARWGNAEELLAILVEVVDFGNRNFIRFYSKKGTSGPKPIKIPRPKSLTSPAPKKKMSTPEEIKRRLGKRIRVQLEEGT